MGASVMPDPWENRRQRDAELEQSNRDLMALNARLGIQSTLQTVMATTGPDAFVGVSTGHAIVRISQLEALADEIAKLRAIAGGYR